MIVNAHHVSYACMQSFCAHDAPHYTAQALCAREKREVVSTHAFVLLYCRRVDLVCDLHGIGGSGKNCEQRCTARRIGGCDNHCDDNDAQHDRASHGQRGRDVLIPPKRLQEIASQACDAQPDPKRLTFAAVENCF
jgi:hypothetical protein